MFYVQNNDTLPLFFTGDRLNYNLSSKLLGKYLYVASAACGHLFDGEETNLIDENARIGLCEQSRTSFPIHLSFH